MSRSYSKPAEKSSEWWKFWEACCSDDHNSLMPKPLQNKPIKYETEKAITHHWSKEDDRKLIHLAEKYNYDWKAISEKFSEKSAHQLESRWKNKLNPNTLRTPWTDEEDIVLKTLVLEFGYEWHSISKYMKGRNASAIEKRFKNGILPYLNQREITIIQSKIEANKKYLKNYEMDLDVNEKEESLGELNGAVEELTNAVKETMDQITILESELYESDTLLVE